MRSTFLFTIILLAAAQITYGQGNPPTTPIYEQTITPPSPSTAALDRYIDCPVSYSTGVPDITIPIYNLKSTKLSVPISFSYHGGGLKVMDRSQYMGLGWSLNAGGEISRVVQDIPDELNDSNFHGYLSMIYPDESNPNASYFKDLCLGNEIYNVYVNGAAKYDGQPDLFFYNFNGQGGKFLFRNRVAAGIDPQAVTIPYTPIKIAWLDNYSYFQLTDHEGNIYIYGDHADSQDSYTNPEHDASAPQGATTAWHLTKIVSADKTDSIMFSYVAKAGGYTFSPNNNAVTCSYTFTNPPTLYQAVGIPSISTSPTVEYLLAISEITCANGKVDFTYDSNNRLNLIDIYSNTNNTLSELKRFTLSQSNFTMTPEGVFASEQISPSGIARPRLDAIQETGYINNVAAVTNPAYKFNYVSADVPDLFSKSQDYWGFYNGKDNPDMLMINRDPSTGYVIPAYQKRAADPVACMKGMLQSITYPTGGTTNFTFDPNQFYTAIPSSNEIPRSVNYHISTLYLQPNNQTSGESLTFNLNPQVRGQVKIDFTGALICTPSGSCVTNTPEVKLIDVTQNITVADITLSTLIQNVNPQTSQEAINYYTLNAADQYKLYFPTPGNTTYLGQSTKFRMDAVMTQTLLDSTATSYDSTTFYTGGVRIKQIQHNDGNGNTITKNYNYTIPYWNSNLFKGDYSTIANWLTRSKSLIEADGVGASPPLSYISTIIYSEGFSIPIGSTNNSSASYQQVEESMSGNGVPLGKNVYTYNTALDYISPKFSTFRFDTEYDRSQLLDTKTYKNNSTGGYVLIKDVANTYNNLNDNPPTIPGADSIKYYVAYSDFDYQKQLALAGEVRFPSADNSDNEGGPITESYLDAMPVPGCPIYNYNFNNISPFYYHVVKQLLTSVITTDYDQNGQNPLISETDYAYDNLTHIQPTRVTSTNSNIKVKVETTKYPLDYSFQGSCNPLAAVTSFNQQLIVLKAQRDQCEQTTATMSDNNYPQHMLMVNAYATCESTYNTAVANLVTQYNTSVSQYQSCYTAAETALTANDKAIAYMQDKNMVVPKIDVSTTVNANPVLKVHTDYMLTDAAKNIIRPQQVNVQVRSNAIEPRANFYAYDSSGNLLEQSKTGDTHTSYQWGYNNTYPVVQVTNAPSKDIFYDSFEEGDGNSTAEIAKTGHYSYNGSTTPYTHTFSRLDPGSYILSYWLRSPTSGTWSLVSTTVSAGATYTITGISGQIDDVRFYPTGAQMTTYTYDPLIGMTSSTDAKNETTYYEYDGFERLLNIKDKDGNIIKHTDYHYQGQ